MLEEEIERILLLIAEEGAEIAQAASKAIRFTLDSKNPYVLNAPTKREDLIQELGDLLLLVDLMEIDYKDIQLAKEKKIRKVLAGPDLDLKTILLNHNYIQKINQK